MNNQPQQTGDDNAAPTPQETGDTEVVKAAQTKAYSELHNQHKELKSSYEKTQQELAGLRRQVTKQSDSGKDVDQLMNDLNEQRTLAEQSKTKLDSFNTSMQEMVDASIEGLTEAQKKQVGFASEDPFKRMQFIQTLKADARVPVRTSQGNAVSDNDITLIDIDNILERAATGDVSAYREAKKKHGEDVVKKFIAQRTQQKVEIQ